MGRGVFGGFSDGARVIGTTRAFPVSVTVTAGTNVADNVNARRRREHIQLDPDLWRQMLASNAGLAIYNQVFLTLGSFKVPLTVQILERQTAIATARIGVEALARFPGASLPSAGTLTAYVPSSGVSDATAQSGGLYYEYQNDNGSNTNTIVISPHGGLIEQDTDTLADEMKVALDAVGKTTSIWGGRGYGINGQTSYNAHHISTVDIDPRLNAILLPISGRVWSRGIGLHGQSTTSRIDLGCPAAQNTFVDSLVTALQAKPALSGITIARTEDSEIQGTNLNNLGNRLAPTHYVQVEMGLDVRNSVSMRAAITQVFATAYTPL